MNLGLVLKLDFHKTTMIPRVCYVWDNIFCDWGFWSCVNQLDTIFFMYNSSPLQIIERNRKTSKILYHHNMIWKHFRMLLAVLCNNFAPIQLSFPFQNTATKFVWSCSLGLRNHPENESFNVCNTLSSFSPTVVSVIGSFWYSSWQVSTVSS